MCFVIKNVLVFICAHPEEEEIYKIISLPFACNILHISLYANKSTLSPKLATFVALISCGPVTTPSTSINRLRGAAPKDWSKCAVTSIPSAAFPLSTEPPSLLLVVSNTNCTVFPENKPICSPLTFGFGAEMSMFVVVIVLFFLCFFCSGAERKEGEILKK